MRVGLDTFTIRELGLDARGQLDFCKENGLAGAQFGGMGGFSKTLDPGEIQEFRDYANSLGLYAEVSVGFPNPHLGGQSIEARVEAISKEIPLAAKFGWHELHSVLGGPDNRYSGKPPWLQQLADSTEVIRQLGPILREHGSRINLETHGETTTFELVRMAEELGPDIMGICLDTANVFVFAEDPVEAAKRAAPYTHLTHTKDGIIYFSDKGIERQGRCPGEGALDFEQILPILAEHSPDLPLSIEDHKWLFEAEIFTPEWHAQQADLSREELGKVVGIAWEWQKKIDSGECPKPADYEEIPYTDQLEHRVSTGRDHLNGILDRLGLQS